MSETPSTPKKPPVDWERVELDYRAGIKTLRQIADDHGITHGAVNKRAKAKGWTRDLSAKIQAKVARPVLVADLDTWDAGYVYAIKIHTGLEPLYKIGKAKSPQLRLEGHQTSLPFDASICIAYFCGNARAEERMLHSQFAGKRVRGEWFRLDDSDLDAMAKRARLA